MDRRRRRGGRALRGGAPRVPAAWKRSGGRPTINEVRKVHVGFRLAADVVNHLKASGKGYGNRVEQVLRDAIARGVL